VFFVALPVQAEGRRVLNYPVPTTVSSNVRLPVGVTTTKIVYPIVKVLPPVRMARAISDAMAYGGAAAVIATAMMSNYNGDSLTDTITYNSTTNEFSKGEKYAGTWGPSSGYTGGSGCGGKVFSEAYSCSWAKQVLYWTNNGGYQAHSPIIGTVNSTTKSVSYTRCNSAGLSCDSSYSYWITRSSSSYPAGYSPGEPTDEQLSAIAGGDFDWSPYSARDFFEDPVTGMPDNIANAGHEPLPMTDSQREQLNEDLSPTGACDPSGDQLVYELCVLGKEHGVETSPPATDVPEATQPEGGTGTGTTTDYEPDTPGGTFTEPELETLDTFHAITLDFLDRLESSPIPAAFAAVTSTWPTGTCPSGVVNLGPWIGEQNMSAWSCPLWEDTIAPILSVLMLALWGFIGLRIIMSA
jgi:hypothetical protein